MTYFSSYSNDNIKNEHLSSDTDMAANVSCIHLGVFVSKRSVHHISFRALSKCCSFTLKRLKHLNHLPGHGLNIKHIEMIQKQGIKKFPHVLTQL